MEEKTTKKQYTWGLALYYSMLCLMGFYGIVRLFFTLTESVTHPDTFPFKVTWSVFFMSACFMISSFLGLRGIMKNKKNYKVVLILSCVSAVFALFTTFKLIGMINSADLLEGTVLLSAIWIIFGICPPVLLMGSVLSMWKSNCELVFEDDNTEGNSEDAVTEDSLKEEDNGVLTETKEIEAIEAEDTSEKTTCEEKKPAKAKLTTLKVFGKTFSLVTGRVALTLCGVLAFAIILLIGFILDHYIWGLEPDAALGVDILFALVGFVAYYIISKIAKSTFRNAEITAVSYAFEHDEYIEKGIKTSHILDQRFQVVSLFPMIIRSLDCLLAKAFFHKDKLFCQRMNGEWLRSFWDFIACFLTSFVPVLGFSSLSWFLQHPDDGVLKGACDGLYGIYINKAKLVKRMIFVFFMEMLVLFLLGIIFAALFMYLFMTNSFVLEYIVAYGALASDDLLTSVLSCSILFSILFVKFIPWLYVQSYGMISVLQIYTKATQDNPPGTAPLYTKLMKIYMSYKQKRKDKKQCPGS